MTDSAREDLGDAPPLVALQRWFQAVVTHPSGVAAGAESASAIAAIPATAVDEVACASARQTAAERLAVYAHAYWARLLECLREEFPVLRATVGDEAFDGLAVGYLIAHPSTSYTLCRLSDQFPEYLRATISADAAADAFTALVADLATLERAVNDVFDAPGGETLGYLTAEQLDSVAPADRSSLRLSLLPTVRLLAFRTDANAFFAAVRSSPEALPTSELCPTFLALTRRGYVVRRHPLTATQFDLLTAIAAGQTLADALGSVVDADSITSNDLQTWFAAWAQAGIFAALEA